MLRSENSRFLQQRSGGPVTELKPGPSGQQRGCRTPRVFRGTGVYLDGTPVGSFSINLTGHLFSALSLAAERLGRRHAPAFFEQRLRSCDAYAGYPSLVCIAPQQINHKGRVFVHHAFTQAWCPLAQSLVDQDGAQVVPHCGS